MDNILEVISNSGINLSGKSKKLLLNSYKLLGDSHDPINGLCHSNNLIKFFLRILDSDKPLANSIDYETIILAIFWHDIWKALNHKRNITWLVMSLFEGPLSSRYFIKASRDCGLDRKLEIKVNSIISNHGFIYWNRRSLESRVFHDIDLLDNQNQKRLYRKLTRDQSNLIVRLAYQLHSLLPKRYYISEISKLQERL